MISVTFKADLTKFDGDPPWLKPQEVAARERLRLEQERARFDAFVAKQSMGGTIQYKTAMRINAPLKFEMATVTLNGPSNY